MGWIAGWVVAAAALAVWVYLIGCRGFFWRTSIRLPRAAHPGWHPGAGGWPSVAVVVPARNEAALLPTTVPTLRGQDYPGPFRVLVVDDDSIDGTGDVATALGVTVVRTAGPPAGWAGKVAAMAAGVAAASEPAGAASSDVPLWLLFTDADIALPPSGLTDLVRAAEDSGADLVSQMARLRTESFWERWIVPAFVYFFAQLYPFRWVNSARTAAAAGGCMLVRRTALESAGGLAAIRSALIDDVALGRLLGAHGRIWLGLAPEVRSVRAYPRLADLWSMVARSAYDQLRYSPVLLVATVAGLAVTYLVPPAAVVVGAATADPVLTGLGAAAWAMMAASYVPMLRCYGLGWWRAALLPVVAALYAAMTMDSARRHLAGRGGEWKGRHR